MLLAPDFSVKLQSNSVKLSRVPRSLGNLVPRPGSVCGVGKNFSGFWSQSGVVSLCHLGCVGDLGCVGCGPCGASVCVKW